MSVMVSLHQLNTSSYGGTFIYHSLIISGQHKTIATSLSVTVDDDDDILFTLSNNI